MGKKFIGKRVRLIVGDGPVPEDDPETIIGQDNTVQISKKEAKKYNTIIGEKIEVGTKGQIDEDVRSVINTLKTSNEPNKEKIIEAGKKVIGEKQKNKKLKRLKELVTLSKDVTIIATYIAKLIHFIN